MLRRVTSSDGVSSAIDLTTLPLTLLTSVPFKSPSRHLQVVHITLSSPSSPLSHSHSHSPSSPSSSSSTPSSTPPLHLLFQLSHTRHVYVYNFGSLTMKVAGRHLSRVKQRPMVEVIERFDRWQAVQRGRDKSREGARLTEVGSGAKPLEHGDRIEAEGGVVGWEYEDVKMRSSTRRASDGRPPLNEATTSTPKSRSRATPTVQRQGSRARRRGDGGGTEEMRVEGEGSEGEESRDGSGSEVERSLTTPHRQRQASPIISNGSTPHTNGLQSTQRRGRDDTRRKRTRRSKVRGSGSDGEEVNEVDEREVTSDEEHESANRRERKRKRSTSVVRPPKRSRRRGAGEESQVDDEEEEEAQEEKSDSNEEEVDDNAPRRRRGDRLSSTAPRQRKKRNKPPPPKRKTTSRLRKGEVVTSSDQTGESEKDSEGDNNDEATPTQRQRSRWSASSSSSTHSTAGRRLTRGSSRRTRSSGKLEKVEELNDTRNKKKNTHDKKKKKKKEKQAPTPIRRMRRTPLSLVSPVPSSLSPLLPSVTCRVCGQLFVHPVTLPCSHSFCDYCLYSHLTLKSGECPECEAAVDEEDREAGHYCVYSEALDKTVEAVADVVLDEKGKKKRRRRVKLDGAEMKEVRTRWRRKEGIKKRSEKRERDKAEVEEQMALLRKAFKRQPKSSGVGGKRKVESEDEEEKSDRVGSDEDEMDDDFVPNSDDFDSEDSDAAVRRGGDGSEEDSSSSSGDDSGSASSSSSSSPSSSRDDEVSDSGSDSGGSDAIKSSEEDSDQTLDPSLIIPSPRRARPQRTTYTATHFAPNRRRPIPTCKFCQQGMKRGELVIRIDHGEEVQWSHCQCLSESITGRSIPVSKLKGMTELTEEERERVKGAWVRDEVADRWMMDNEDEDEEDDEHQEED